MGTRLDIPELREYLIGLYERILKGEKVQQNRRKVSRGSYLGLFKICNPRIYNLERHLN